MITQRAKRQLFFTEEAFRAWRRERIYFGLSIVAAIILALAAPVAFAAEAPNVGDPELSRPAHPPTRWWRAASRRPPRP